MTSPAPTTEALDGSTTGRPPDLWRLVALPLLLYAACLAAATWPFATELFASLPSDGDPLQHLWVMRRAKASLLGGASPLLCPDLQYPVGAPIGNFSPLHLQSLIYLVVSSFVRNDAFCYNAVWSFGMLSAGMGTYALALRVLGDGRAAWLAGLLAMLSGPMMVHAHAHVELIYIGGFPIFMMAWMRFVDRPGLGRLGAAVAAYALVAMCAAYFAIFAVLPATLYVGWKGCGAGRGGRLPWLVGRAGWLAGFSAAALMTLVLLFTPQLWSLRHGHSVERPRWEFDRYGAPWWAYFVPPADGLLSDALPFDPYGAAGVPGEGVAYLGVVTLLLLHRAAIRRVRFRDAGFWWLAAGVLALLSLGSGLPFGSGRIDLPAGWLRDWLPPFRLIRVPARFKLFVPVCTGIIAGAAWLHISGGIKRPLVRRIAPPLVALAAVADLAHVPFMTRELPGLPHGYTWLREYDDEATWVDAPQMASSTALGFHCFVTYWQALHGGRTTAGYSGQPHPTFDDLLTWNSPFADYRLVEPGYLERGEREQFDVVMNADVSDYAWLYLHRHDLRYVVAHRWIGAGAPYRIGALADRFSDATIYDDGMLAIIARDRMPPPSRPVPLCSEGWGTRTLLPRDGFVRLAGSVAEVDLYNPDGEAALVFALRARSFLEPRRVRVMAGDREVARWDLDPREQRLFVSEPFDLPGGMGSIRIESDGAIGADRVGRRFHGATHPASLIVSGVCLRPAGAGEGPGGSLADRADETDASVR